MLSVQPSIDARLAALAPGFRAITISVQAAPLIHPQVGEEALIHACACVAAGEPVWADAHLAAWDEVFKQFGAKPKRTPCSAQALRKRVLRDGVLPAIDPIVDLYNAISLRYAVPVGGENIAAYVGAPCLTLADGSEPFDTLKEGEPALESPEPGEVIWRDAQGVTCRRWNWRQGVRTRLSAADSQMWFILEGLPAMPLDALCEAGDELIAGLGRMMPGCHTEKSLIGFA